MKFLCPIHRSAQREPDAIAIRDTTRVLSYRELDELIKQFAKRMAALGIDRKDRIAILSRNSIEYAAAVFAAIRLGAFFMPINLRRSKIEWQQMFTAVSPRIILTDENDYSGVNFPVPHYPLKMAAERTLPSSGAEQAEIGRASCRERV